MVTYVKYRGASKVPATVVGTVKKGSKVYKKLMPRADWRNPGEKLPITRSADKVYHQSVPIPRRKKHGK